MRPDVSVIVAAFNAADLVEAAVASALAQRGVEVEVIIVDDASSDDTLARVRGLGDRRVTVIARDRNGGPAAARNTGLAAAQGTWIAVLDADDAMEPDRLSRLVADAERLQATIIADNLIVERRDPRGPVSVKMMFDETFLAHREWIDLAALLNGSVLFSDRPDLGYVKPLFRADFLTRHGLRYDERLRVGEDFMLLAECVALGARFALHPVPGYRYRAREGSVSHRLTGPVVADMIAANQRFAREHALAPPEIRALRRRAQAFRDALAFTESVEQIKTGRYLRALLTALNRPRVLPLFRLPILARLRRLQPL